MFYADDLCLMAPCAIALQELLNICHSYSIIVDLNFNAKKSFCFAFTPRLFKFSLPDLHINNIPISYVDSVKYLGFTFAGAHKDDHDILRQMRTLYARSNWLLRIFRLSLEEATVARFIVIIYGRNSISQLYLRFV